MAIPKNISVQDFRQAKFDENANISYVEKPFQICDYPRINNLYIVSDISHYTLL